MTSTASPRVWLISGANTGLGLELVLKVIAENEKVVAAVRTPSKAPAALQHPNVKILAFDLSWPQEKINDFVKDAVAAWGKLDVVVNNAGYGYMGAIEESTDELLKQQFDINFFGIVRVIRAVLPYFRAQRSGVIANISSVGGLLSLPGNGMYCATKHALEAVTQALVGEVAGFGVRALAIEPGYFRTEFLKDPAAGANLTQQMDVYRGTPADDARKALELYNGKQPGDPKVGVVRMWEAITGEGMYKGKPLRERVFLGSDCATMVREEVRKINETLDETKDAWSSTDFRE